ncbi:hypothetical protein GGTG_10525 [Gaeumannomyces tritici R3-111a-1]|uniref:Uncharacterized protein n=1 Tax=Gaeumannomyces tritici (strain R3-111a-1) TaxID=644352 RepID=J3PAK0_GAET3|nr:hypothetical protein GGTG_10525 [Gaeumannomyces tritici R3-111a-1]EJT71266.1 hypothetical protein GGTG_10525 [Gaeumannomyces tritici R3-111a-1]
MRFLAYATAALAAAPSAAHAKAVLLPRAAALSASPSSASPGAGMLAIALGRRQDTDAETTATTTATAVLAVTTTTTASIVSTVTAVLAVTKTESGSCNCAVGNNVTTATTTVMAALPAVTKTNNATVTVTATPSGGGVVIIRPPIFSPTSKSGSYCCLEGFIPQAMPTGDRHMVVNVWTKGWGDEPDGCHKGLLDNLKPLSGGLHMLFKCRVDALGGDGSARVQFSKVLTAGSDSITQAIEVASPGRKDAGVHCQMGCPREQLWDGVTSGWLT